MNHISMFKLQLRHSLIEFLLAFPFEQLILANFYNSVNRLHVLQ